MIIENYYIYIYIEKKNSIDKRRKYKTAHTCDLFCSHFFFLFKSITQLASTFLKKIIKKQIKNLQIL